MDSAKSFGKSVKLSEQGVESMPAIPSCIIEPIWQQFADLLPDRKADHPLGCHHPRIPDRVVFDKLVQVLVFGAPTRGSPTRRVRLPPCGVVETNGSLAGSWAPSER